MGRFGQVWNDLELLICVKRLHAYEGLGLRGLLEKRRVTLFVAWAQGAQIDCESAARAATYPRLVGGQLLAQPVRRLLVAWCTHQEGFIAVLQHWSPQVPGRGQRTCLQPGCRH